MKRLCLILGVLLFTIISIAYFVVDRPWAWDSPAPLAPETAGATPANAATIEITYIANEGVLISSGDKQVLLDGLHREYGPEYAFLPPAQREKIETAQAPFDEIDLILLSHLHLDHFETVVAVLSEAVRSSLQSPLQASRTVSPRNHCRRSLSSIQTSIRLAVATSP